MCSILSTVCTVSKTNIVGNQCVRVCVRARVCVCVCGKGDGRKQQCGMRKREREKSGCFKDAVAISRLSTVSRAKAPPSADYTRVCVYGTPLQRPGCS